DRPRARLPAAPPAAGRARRRPQPRGGRGARRVHPQDPRRLRADRPPGRAPHEPRHGDLRPRLRPRLRPADRVGRARRGAEQPGRDRGLPGAGTVVAALLELQDVEARYGATKALHGISLEVEEGTIVAVLGANGAGKTTTLRAVSGTVRRSGEILFDG